MKSERMVKAKKFDAQFDQGKDVSGYLDLRSIKIHHPVQRINVDIPKDLLQKVDEEAARIGVPRTSLLKLWIAERLEHLAV